MQLAILILCFLLSLTLNDLNAAEGIIASKAQKSSMCVSTLKSTCRVSTPYGDYYVPKGWEESSLKTKNAVLIDLGGPGVFPGLLERFDHNVLPSSMLKDRLVIILGAGWGVSGPSKKCSDLLQQHVFYVRGELKDKPSLDLITNACQMKEATSNYAKKSASLVRKALSDWGVESYKVVGASYAASRWQGMLAELEPKYLPDHLTMVSPLVADTSINTIAKWQANTVGSIWQESCSTLESSEAIIECNDTIAAVIGKDKISGLMMLAWSPMAANEFVGYIENNKDQLESLVKKLSNQYFFLNAVKYPRNELFEYLVGVCSSVVIDDHDDSLYGSDPLISKNVLKMVTSFHSICGGFNQSYGSVPHNIPTCYIELGNERITPPSVSSIHGIKGDFKNVIHFSEKGYHHGDFRVIKEMSNTKSCEPNFPTSDFKITELTPNLLEMAKKDIGIERFFIPVLSEKYQGEFHLGNIMLAKGKNEVSFIGIENKVEKNEIVGYCLIGWLVPDNGDKGRSYIMSIGLDGNKSPSCDRQEEVEKYSSSVGRISIAESFSCPVNESCHTDVRKEVTLLTNGSKFIQLQ